MNKYEEFKKVHEKEIKKLPIYLANNEDELKQALLERGLKANEHDRLKSLGGWGFCINEDYDSIVNTLSRLNGILVNELLDDDFLRDTLLHQLEKHRPFETLGNAEFLTATFSNLPNVTIDERMHRILNEARKTHIENLMKDSENPVLSKEEFSSFLDKALEESNLDIGTLSKMLTDFIVERMDKCVNYAINEIENDESLDKDWIYNSTYLKLLTIYRNEFKLRIPKTENEVLKIFYKEEEDELNEVIDLIKSLI